MIVDDISPRRVGESCRDQLPIQCERIIKFTNGTFQPVSKLKCAGAAT